jgi:hypothetical protein
MSTHARLAPSAAHRWMNCAAAPRLEADMPNYSSTYADEGTVLHGLMSKYLPAIHRDPTHRNVFAKLHGTRVVADDPDVRPIESLSQEQIDALEWCAEAFCREVPQSAQVMVEQKVYIPDRDDCYGTSDVIAYLPVERRLLVLDWKFGAGVQVDARENEQALIYALGALALLDDLCDIDTVRIVIAQPRLDHHDVWDIPVDELRSWLPRVVEAARATDRSEAEPIDGDWCRFCAARSRCPALRATALRAARVEFGALEVASEDQLAEAMRAVPRIEAWIKEIRAETERRLIAGKRVPGYKLGEGRRSQQYVDPAKAEAWAQVELGAEGFKKPELLTPAQLRAAAKRMKVSMDESLIEWRAGATSVVPEDSDRTLLTQAQHEFKALPADDDL